MSEVGQRLAELLHARANEVNVTFDLDDVKRAGLVDLVVPERREQPLDRQRRAQRVAEFGATEYPDADRVAHQSRLRWVTVAAATIVVLTLGLVALAVRQEPNSVQTDTDQYLFAMTSPSADEEAQATDDDLYRDFIVGTQVSAAGNSVSLRRCRDSAAATCGTGWAYVTETAGGGEMHGGLLGEAGPVNLHLHLLDDRYFVVTESAPGTQAPARAWLIDAVSGQVGQLSWRDEPTTLNSPEQMLMQCEESHDSGGTECDVAEVWDDGLPKVVDSRDGTIRPLAMPDNVVAGLRVAQHGTGRIWIGTDPGGDRLGLAYTDDGGATWTQVALPEQLGAASEELATIRSSGFGGDLLEIAAEGDRVAVADSWGPPGDDNTVYVSDDAGTSWTTAASEPDGNGVHLYVLADGRLVVMGSMDAHPRELLVSTGSDWAELENVDVDFDPASPSDQERRFSVNSGGVAMIPLLIYPCDNAYPCPGYTESEAQGYVLDTIAYSSDLTNWSTIQIFNRVVVLARRNADDEPGSPVHSVAPETTTSTTTTTTIAPTTVVGLNPDPSLSPPEPAVAQLLTDFLDARIAGSGAERFVNSSEVEIPLLYATSDGLSYDRAEFEPAPDLGWPYEFSAYTVRLFAGDTVVEQIFFTAAADLGLEYQPDGFGTNIAPSTVDGQAVGVRHDYFDGAVSVEASHPWILIDEVPYGRLIPDDPDMRPTTDGGERTDWDKLYLIADPGSADLGCALGQTATDAAALAEILQSDPYFGATAPVAVSVGDGEALMMDLVIPDGTSVCAPESGYDLLTPIFDRNAMTSTNNGIATGTATGALMRLYLYDAPEGSSMQVLAIAIVAPESNFQRAVATAAPIAESVEFHVG